MKMISFSKAERLNASYPLYAKEGVVEENILSGLLDDFPENKLTSEAKVVMGGRFRIASDEIAFYDFLKSSTAWSRFYDYINDEKFIAELFSVFENEDEWNRQTTNLKSLKLNKNYFLKKAQLKKWLPSKLINALYKVIDRMPWKKELFLHVDISAAADGYQREIHRDTDQRVLVFLVHFSNQEEVGGEGGEFGVHSYLNPPNRSSNERQPPNEMMQTDLMIKAKKNLGVAFLSTYNAYHSVPEMKNTKGLRKFIYVGVSLRGAKRWQ